MAEINETSISSDQNTGIQHRVTALLVVKYQLLYISKCKPKLNRSS